MQFGKYRSRRKQKAKKPRKKKGAGLVGDIGKGLNEVGKFVETSGKKITDVTADVAAAGGKAISGIGSMIKDKKVSKGFKKVGSTMSGTAKDVVKAIGKASPYIGKAGQFVGSAMMKSDTDYQKGGSLFDSMGYKDNHHAHSVLGNLDHDDFVAIRSAAKYISGHPMDKDDLDILPHRPFTTVGMKHFHTIASSTPETLMSALKNDKSQELHRAMQTSAHSAHLAGDHDFHSHGHTHLGGGFFDNVGKEFGKASVLAGKIGLAASPVVSLVAPEFGVPLAAVSGAAVGIGKAVNDAYGQETKVL